MSSIRQRLNLTAPSGEQLFITQLSNGAAFTAEGTMTMTLPTLKLVSGAQTVNNVANSILSNATAITTEVNNRTVADSSLQSNIDAEAAARATAVNNEATTRSTAVATLQTNINAEATAREAADITLQGNINAEATARAAAVTAEADARAAADNNLQTNLQTNIDTETSERQNDVYVLTTNLNTESNARATAVATLQSNIDAQKARIDAILNLSTTELDSFKEIADAYQDADSNLQTLITNLTTDFNALKAVVDALATNTESSGV